MWFIIYKSLCTLKGNDRRLKQTKLKILINVKKIMKINCRLKQTGVIFFIRNWHLCYIAYHLRTELKTSLLEKQWRHKYDNEFRDATYPHWIMRDTRPPSPGLCESERGSFPFSLQIEKNKPGELIMWIGVCMLCNVWDLILLSFSPTVVTL